MKTATHQETDGERELEREKGERERREREREGGEKEGWTNDRENRGKKRGT